MCIFELTRLLLFSLLFWERRYKDQRYACPFVLDICILYYEFLFVKISHWGLDIGSPFADLQQNDVVTPFFDQLQGAKIIDESHDQDTTDLHKCISFITTNPPGPDNSNVLNIN
jgi:hypothetical protein